MSVALSVFVILLITAPGLLAEPPALPTAVFTLDVERRTFDYEDIDSFQEKFQRWVRRPDIKDWVREVRVEAGKTLRLRSSGVR